MTSFDIYKLHFQTALHLSKGKLNSYESSDTTLHSDTLKSALFVSMLHLYDEVEANAFMDSVQVSSAFPFDKDNFWLPRPVSFEFADKTTDNRKKFKGVKFFTASQYAKILRGIEPTLESDNKSEPKQPDIWERDVTQRVKINYEADSEPFYLEKLYPKDKETSGLYFIFQLNGYDATKLAAAMKLLGDNGLGLQRTLGNGQFTYKKDTLNLDLPDNPTAWVALSLYRPTDKKEIESVLDKSHYQFIKRGGWIASPEFEEHLSIRKQAVMMFTEGSVFGFEENGNSALIKGFKENVRPEWNDDALHPVFRDGRAIFLPINI
jgi:CRISPR-associated protein Csm4